MGLYTWAAAILAGVVAVSPGGALAASGDFKSFLDGVRAEARQKGVRAATLEAALKGVAPIEKVIELDRRQPEFTLTFQQYIDRVVGQNRVDKGRELLHQHRAVLTAVSARHKVPAPVIVALWGIESDFGRITGGFPVVSALATLAYDGRRPAYFRGELMNALKILDQGHIKPGDMKGSWAGAMGQSQFMPSSFLAYAVDFNEDGRRDIWGTEADVFASIANYLAKVGWKPDQPWGREVMAPAGFDRGLAGGTKVLAEWSGLGLRGLGGAELSPADRKAKLVAPDREPARLFLAYDNHQVYLKWNRSTYFALAAGMLADRLARE